MATSMRCICDTCNTHKTLDNTKHIIYTDLDILLHRGLLFLNIFKRSICLEVVMVFKHVAKN